MQFYGVAHMPLIDTEDDERPDDSYIAIGRMCDGAPVLFKKGSEKIAVYFSDDGEIDDDLVYGGFYAFLDELYDLLGLDYEDGDDDWDDDDDDWGEDGDDDEEDDEEDK